MITDNQPHWIYNDSPGHLQFILDLMAMAAAGGYTFVPRDHTTGFRDLAFAAKKELAADPVDVLAADRATLDEFVDDLLRPLQLYVWQWVPGVGFVKVPIPVDPDPQPPYPWALTGTDLLDLAARFEALARLAPAAAKDFTYARDRLYDEAVARLRPAA